MRFIGLRTQADFLDLDLGLGFLCLTILLCPLIDELSKVHHSADRRGGVGRNLDKIQLGVACNLQGLLDGNNTDVAAVWPDQSDLWDADALIYSKFCSADKFLLFENS